PDIQKWTKERDQAAKDLAERKKAVHAELEVYIRDRRKLQAADSQFALRRRIEIQKQTEEALTPEVEKLSKLAEAVKDSALDLSDLEFEIKQKEDVVRTVLNERDKLTVEINDPYRVARFQEAVTYAPETTLLRRAQYAAGGALTGLLLVVFLVSYREF